VTDLRKNDIFLRFSGGPQRGGMNVKDVCHCVKKVTDFLPTPETVEVHKCGLAF
jgi:hypothetical protein